MFTDEEDLCIREDVSKMEVQAISRNCIQQKLNSQTAFVEQTVAFKNKLLTFPKAKGSKS